MISGLPVTRDLVLLGGGHTHALVLRKWAMAPVAGVRVTLVNPGAKAVYTGMLPGYVAGHYNRSDLDIDLVRLARRAGARLILDKAVGIDTDARRVQLSTRPDVAYDTLSIDIGITSDLSMLDGFARYGVPAKPLGRFAKAWDEYVGRVASGLLKAEIALIGGGVAGIELALAMAFRLEALGVGDRTINVLEAQSDILRELSSGARRKLLAELDRFGVTVMTGVEVQQVCADHVRLGAQESPLTASLIVSAAGATPHAWLAETGLPLRDGYIVVDETLRADSTPNVFAAGDCAHLSHAPRPKAGVFAVRQAPVLLDNLCADLTGGPMASYQPQRSYLKLISTGRTSAVMDKWGLALDGNWVWRLKNRIDQKFMDQFREPAAMAGPDLPDEMAPGVADLAKQFAHHCGGCGSKIGQQTLHAGLENTAEPGRLDDAAIISRDGRYEVLTTDHLRAFTPDPWLMGKVAAVHALGDIWAMGAVPSTVLAQFILPAMSERLQADTIRELMAGANEVFAACGTQIAGGHTSSGAELTVGFSIAGQLASSPVTQAGGRAGDVLVMTKPIGTGVLLAAEMRQEADGEDYQHALASMCRLQSRAAEQLSGVATAMTDITGFGLAGHLMNILDASGVAADVELKRVPVLAGAEALSGKGIRSTLWAQNAALAHRIESVSSARADLIFDPQTCGGLLACVPPDALEDLLARFETAGEPIWVIGELTEGVPAIRLT